MIELHCKTGILGSISRLPYGFIYPPNAYSSLNAQLGKPSSESSCPCQSGFFGHCHLVSPAPRRTRPYRQVVSPDSHTDVGVSFEAAIFSVDSRQAQILSALAIKKISFLWDKVHFISKLSFLENQSSWPGSTHTQFIQVQKYQKRSRIRDSQTPVPLCGNAFTHPQQKQR